MPTYFGAWIAQILPGPLPSETEATCDKCAMADPLRVRTEPFDSGLKCCAYDPELPNFLIGAMLRDRDPQRSDGVSRMIARVTGGMPVTPLGLAARPRFTENPGFGRRGNIPCYFFDPTDGGRCTIWTYREAVCSTWFCKYQQGERGFIFWAALRRLLILVQRSVARKCLLALDFSPEALAILFPPGESSAGTTVASRVLRFGQLPKSLPTAAWSGWKDRKVDFYRRCAEVADELSWAEALACAGSEGEVMATLVEEAYSVLCGREIPDPLVRDTAIDYRLDGDAMLVTTFSSYDRMSLDLPLFDALCRFDGRPSAEVLAEILEQDGIELTTDRLLYLVEQGLLKSAKT